MYEDIYNFINECIKIISVKNKCFVLNCFLLMYIIYNDLRIHLEYGIKSLYLVCTKSHLSIAALKYSSFKTFKLQI